MPENASETKVSLQVADALKSYAALLHESVPVLEKKLAAARTAFTSEIDRLAARALETEAGARLATAVDAVRTTSAERVRQLNARTTELRTSVGGRVHRARETLLATLGIATRDEVAELARTVKELQAPAQK